MSLSKLYVRTYSFVIVFANEPIDKQLISDNIVIKTTINSKGWDIVFKKIKNRKLILNLEEYAIDTHGDLIVSNTKALVQENFPDLEIKEVNPAFLTLKFEQLETKKVPIKVNTTKNFAANFFFNEEVRTEPDSIVITSDIETLSHINYIETEKVEITEKDLSLHNISLKAPKYVKLEINKVDAYFNIEEFVEKEFMIPLHIENNLKKLDIIIYPQEVGLKCLVPTKNYETILASDFYISADFNNIELTNNNQLSISIKDKPKSVKNIQLEKDKVEFIIYQ